MDTYPNAHLLTTPAALQAALGGATRPLAHRSSASRRISPPATFPAATCYLDLWGLSLIDTDPGPLKAFMWIVDHLFNLRGVDAKTPVVVYDDQFAHASAARAFWFLEYFGHDHAQMLDGGFGAWIKAGLPVTREAAASAQRARGRARRVRRRLATWREVQSTDLASAGTVILDTRSDRRNPRRLAGPRQAGRRTFPAPFTSSGRATSRPDGAFKPAAGLPRAMYEQAGVTPDRRKSSLTARAATRASARGISRCASSAIRASRITRVHGRNAGDREDLPIQRPGDRC